MIRVIFIMNKWSFENKNYRVEAAGRSHHTEKFRGERITGLIVVS